MLGFPCDQFGHQEPGTEDEIGAFCEKNFGVTFPLFSKVDVNGDDAHPVFQWLRDQKGGLLGSKIKWNFTKFLIGKDGQVIDRFAPTTKPEKLADDIEKALGDAWPPDRGTGRMPSFSAQHPRRGRRPRAPAGHLGRPRRPRR